MLGREIWKSMRKTQVMLCNRKNIEWIESITMESYEFEMAGNFRFFGSIVNRLNKK